MTVAAAHAALDDPATIAWRRVADEWIAQDREVRARRPQWTGQDNFNRDQGSNYNSSGWGK